MIRLSTVKKYCNEDISLIENYDKAINDTTQTWHCHHRLETDSNITQKELKEKKIYYNRPASELIFLTPFEHLHLHNYGKGGWHWHHTEETKQKISKNSWWHNNPDAEILKCRSKKISKKLKGRVGTFTGKKHTEETKQRMSESAKGRTVNEEIRKRISETQRGRKRTIESRLKQSNTLMGHTLTDEAKLKIGISKRGRIGISKNGVKKYINPDDFKIYHAKGWRRGLKS